MIAAHPELKFRAVHTLTNETPNSDNLYALFECAIDRETGVYLSEDYAFCARWRALGGEIWLDLQSRLTHCRDELLRWRLHAPICGVGAGHRTLQTRDGGARDRRLSDAARTGAVSGRPAYDFTPDGFRRPQNFSFLSRSAALSLVIASVGTVTVSGTDSAQSIRIFLARSSDSAAPVG